MHERDTTPGDGSDAVGEAASGNSGGAGSEAGDGGREPNPAGSQDDGYEIVSLDDAFTEARAEEPGPGDIPPGPAFDAPGTGDPGPRPRRHYTRRASRTVPSADVIAGALIALHGSIALIAKDDIWQLSAPEAKQLSAASHALLAEYGGQVSTRALAWTNISLAVLGVYGTRALAIMVSRPRSRSRRVPPPVSPSAFDYAKAAEAASAAAPYEALAPVHIAGRHG